MPPSAPRVLFFTSNEEDYLSDGLLHGLRTLLGSAVVDFPKNELLYESVPAAARARCHGRAFTLYGRLPELEVDRFQVFLRAQAGDFDLVVFSDIQRQFGYLLRAWGGLDKTRVAVLDGADSTQPFPYTGRFLRVPSLALLPRCRQYPYFKREIDDETVRGYYYRTLPRAVARHVPLPANLRPIAFSIPGDWVVDAPPAKDKDFPEHIVDEQVARHLGRDPRGRYVFDDEASYHADLRRSRFGITTKRAGWDCLRHYEIAAAGAVPCFRELDAKHPLCAPHGLDRSNTIVYGDPADLMRQIEWLSPSEYARLQAASLAWVKEQTTVARARQFLAAMGCALP